MFKSGETQIILKMKYSFFEINKVFLHVSVTLVYTLILREIAVDLPLYYYLIKHTNLIFSAA
jgi:hypothetical protein